MGNSSNGLKVYNINKDEVQSRHVYHFFKRLFDIVASLAGLIVFLPFFLIIMILIFIEDFGGPIYTQNRVGKDGKLFKIYKIRSMVKDADKKLAELKEKNEVDGPMFKMKRDPRVTRVGAFIRKHSIDEIPQLFNVLKGDMTLVGPRPALPSEVAEYSDYDKQRLYVTPGATGLWQATLRSDADFDKMVELDLEYITKASFWYDIKIIFLTIKSMVVPNGAY